jgi:hypothetical protein
MVVVDLVIQGSFNLVFKDFIVYLLPLLRPQLLELQIKLLHSFNKLLGWLGRFVGLR